MWRGGRFVGIGSGLICALAAPLLHADVVTIQLPSHEARRGFECESPPGWDTIPTRALVTHIRIETIDLNPAFPNPYYRQWRAWLGLTVKPGSWDGRTINLQWPPFRGARGDSVGVRAWVARSGQLESRPSCKAYHYWRAR